jgi:hypothetical protein
MYLSMSIKVYILLFQMLLSPVFGAPISYAFHIWNTPSNRFNMYEIETFYGGTQVYYSSYSVSSVFPGYNDPTGPVAFTGILPASSASYLFDGDTSFNLFQSDYGCYNYCDNSPYVHVEMGYQAFDTVCLYFGGYEGSMVTSLLDVYVDGGLWQSVSLHYYSPNCWTFTLPLDTPTALPSSERTPYPSVNPTFAPSFTPSCIPTVVPSTNPTFNPSRQPSFTPSFIPTTTPSATPSSLPTACPSASPSRCPSSVPTSVLQVFQA